MIVWAEQSVHFQYIASQFPEAECTLSTLPTSLCLCSAIRRRCSLHRLLASFLARICGISDEAAKVLKTNVNLEEGDRGLYHDTLRAMRGALAPGAGLECMSRLMIESVSCSLEDLRTEQPAKRISLANWLRHKITLATSEAVYGPDKPFRDPKVEDIFW
jgi:hypothetical protein